jgi:hypothetical protein
MRTVYTVLLDTGHETLAIGRFWRRNNAVAFAQEQESAGRGTLLGVARVLTTDMFRVEFSCPNTARRLRVAATKPGQ